MATRFSALLHPSVQATADFRNVCQFIEDTFITAGQWVVGPDTGQTLPSALSPPTASNQKMGFRIYKMGDALQSTVPVFIRVDYGSSSILTVLALWVTIGTGSDGSGNITGILFNGGATTNATINGLNAAGAGPAQVSNSYGSADPSRVSIALYVQNFSAGYIIPFAIERTKDALGNNSGIGLLFTYKSGSSSQTMETSRVLLFAGGTQPAAEIGLSYVLTTINPSQAFAPGDIGIGILIHFAGISQQPGTSFLVTNSSDISPEGVIRCILYGQPRTYVHLNAIVPGKASGGGAVADNNARILMRYD